jgi:hypothetical protein
MSFFVLISGWRERAKVLSEKDLGRAVLDSPGRASAGSACTASCTDGAARSARDYRVGGRGVRAEAGTGEDGEKGSSAARASPTAPNETSHGLVVDTGVSPE